MVHGDVKDYAGEKKKPSIALVISVGPKMPKKPEDTSTPDEAMKKAWEVMVEDNGTYEISKEDVMESARYKHLMDLYQNDPEAQRMITEYYKNAGQIRSGSVVQNPMNKAFDILKIRSAAPPRKPGAFRRRMPPAPEPEPEPEPEPMEEAPDPEMEARAKQSVVDAINRIRRKRDKFDESKEVVPTSIEEQEGDVEELPFSHFLKPPEER
jgi:hypothetical protein